MLTDEFPKMNQILPKPSAPDLVVINNEFVINQFLYARRRGKWAKFLFLFILTYSFITLTPVLDTISPNL